MKRRPRTAIKDARREAALFRMRAVVGFVAILAGLGVLVGRFVWLQVLHHDEFSTRSEQNRVHVVHLPPARGLIYDRNGVVLADNVP
ncbi:MAG TPA: penicillin-binding protein 2, partial [Burkholderiaceae bacterium]|nr:penicillin-binding protein 2 [Burkholderiaceae bacterium]